MFEWHFTIRGAEKTDFEGGIYHGRILLDSEYPFKPPHIMFLTPSGRFETNTKICLSFSAYHPELWQPAWGIRLILEALISFMPTPGDGAIGALDWSSEERKRLAKKSQSFVCPHCGPIAQLLPKLDPEKKKKTSSYAKEIAKLQQLQQEEHRRKGDADGCSKENEDEIATAADACTSAPTSSSGDSTVVNDDDNTPVTVAPLKTQLLSNDHKIQVREEEREESEAAAEPAATAAVADETTTMEVAVEEEQSAVEQHEIATDDDATAADDYINAISKLYDPLLNISILLMVVICILLIKKGIDLSAELNELRSMPIVDDGSGNSVNVDITSASSSAEL